MVQISTQFNELEIDDFQGKVTQNIVLSQVSWQTFKALLADMGNHRSSRLTYNLLFRTCKKLKIMLPFYSLGQPSAFLD